MELAFGAGVTSRYPRKTERQGWSSSSTELLGAALLRLEVARDLARVRLRQADRATLDRWSKHESTVDQWLDIYERRLAEKGERAVSATIRDIRRLELEVCEFIPTPRLPSPDARHAIEPFAQRSARR
jgi:hypothetical protein